MSTNVAPTNDYLQSLGRPKARTSRGGVVMVPSSTPGAPDVPLPANPELGPQGSQLAIAPWWDKPYESSIPWFVTQRSFTLVAAAANSPITGISFTVPANMKGVLKEFLVEIQNPTTATDVFLTLLRNGQGIPGWTNIPLRAMNAAYEGLPYNDVNIFFDENETFTATLTNNNGATAWTTGLQASGWSSLKTEIKRLQGGLRY